MSKVYIFLNDIPALEQKTILPDVYCPVGGYLDKNLNQRFDSKGEKARYLRLKGMREAEPFNPDKPLPGTGGSNIKQRGSRGNFQAKPLPSWMRKELERHVG